MIGTNLAITTKNYAVAGGVAYDADALAFFTAASITDTTQKNAVNQLVLDLKSASIWTKMKALYPIVGGVASSHAVNLKTPGTYNLTFQTGWTHTSTGMTPNGATYADTNLTQSTSGLDQNNWGFSVYSRTNKTGNSGVSFGNEQAGGGATVMYLKTATNNLASYMNSSNIYFVPNTDSRGFFQSIRNGATTVKLIKNSTINNGSTTSSINHTIPFYLAANNYDGTAIGFDNCEIAFSSIGDGLTDAEASSFYNAVQTYQTTLNRHP